MSAAKLEVTLGPMFSGKSTACIREVRRQRSVRRDAILIKPLRDTRSVPVRSHDGSTLDCSRIEMLCDAYHLPEFKKCDVVLIDEAHFFTDLVTEVQHMLDLGKDVFVYGLNGTATQTPMGAVLNLIPMADNVQWLTALCMYCKGTAPFTVANKALPSDSVLVGGAETYSPVCRKHLNPFWRHVAQ